MAYKFTGRVKKISCDGVKFSYEFDVDNSILCGGERIGIAINENGDIIKVGAFNESQSSIFNSLLQAKNEKLEVKFDKRISNVANSTQGKNEPKTEDIAYEEYEIKEVSILR